MARSGAVMPPTVTVTGMGPADVFERRGADVGANGVGQGADCGTFADWRDESTAIFAAGKAGATRSWLRHTGAQAGRDLPDDLVHHFEAERIVHAPQMVDADLEQRPSPALRIRKRAGQQFLHQLAARHLAGANA